MTSEEIMLALTRSKFPIIQNIVVPNLWWGFNLNHECDLLVVSKSGYATEIEIKVSVSDVKKDLNKIHNHKDVKIKYLWFAIPEKIYEKSVQYIPERAGILCVYRMDDEFIGVKEKREPEKSKNFRKITEAEIKNLQRLMAMRYWSLLKKYVKLKGK